MYFDMKNILKNNYNYTPNKPFVIWVESISIYSYVDMKNKLKKMLYWYFSEKKNILKLANRHLLSKQH